MVRMPSKLEQWSWRVKRKSLVSEQTGARPRGKPLRRQSNVGGVKTGGGGGCVWVSIVNGQAGECREFVDFQEFSAKELETRGKPRWGLVRSSWAAFRPLRVHFAILLTSPSSRHAPSMGANAGTPNHEFLLAGARLGRQLGL